MNKDFGELEPVAVDGGVCVLQGEYAVTDVPGTMIGSDEATSCVVVLAVAAKGTGRVFCAHASDKAQLPECVRLIDDELGSDGPINVYLMGGRTDKRGASFAADAVSSFGAPKYALRVAYVGDEGPLRRGCVYQVGKADSFQPAVWERLEPFFVERNCRWMCENADHLLCVHRDGLWRIEYEYNQGPPEKRKCFASLLGLGDEELLECCSTTPQLESDRFASNLRQCLLFWTSEADPFPNGALEKKE